MIDKKSGECPLCGHKDTSVYFEDKRRPYYLCPVCSLVFVPSASHLSEGEEKKIYDLHENDPDDPGYRRFLSRLSDPLSERITRESRGLDFGCGPGPALCAMLEEKGHNMAKYDKFYFPDSRVLSQKYDFICSTEVVEHLRNPLQVFEILFSMLNKKGWLALMTKMVISQEAFSKWHYIQDQSHICFYSRETFRYLADRYRAEVFFLNKDVIFFQT